MPSSIAVARSNSACPSQRGSEIGLNLEATREGTSVQELPWIENALNTVFRPPDPWYREREARSSLAFERLTSRARPSRREPKRLFQHTSDAVRRVRARTHAGACCSGHSCGTAAHTRWKVAPCISGDQHFVCALKQKLGRNRPGSGERGTEHFGPKPSPDPVSA
jgi:hypothetical protein